MNLSKEIERKEKELKANRIKLKNDYENDLKEYKKQRVLLDYIIPRLEEIVKKM